MNRSRQQDIKLVQRFMFDNSVYMLNMFEKKIDSLINYKQKKVRQKQLQIHRQQTTRLDPNHFFDDPIKTLARDLTKPVWNCIVKMDPVVYIQDQSCIQSGLNQQIIQQIHEKRILYNSLLDKFLHRFKTQHQDESNLKININSYQSNQKYQKFDDKQFLKNYQKYTQQFLNLLMTYIQKQNKVIQQLDLSQIEDNYNYSHLRSTLQAYCELLNSYLQENQLLRNQLNWYVNLTLQSVLNILDSRAGATLLLIQPKIGMINLLIHPLLITIHNLLKYQYNYTDKLKNVDNQKMDQQNIQKMQQQKQILQQQSKYVFTDLKYISCSKIAFINLDGYESQYNLDIVKYLCKNMMYVSFPKQSSTRNQINQLHDFQQAKSQRLLKKYFYQSLTEQQKLQLLKYYQIQQKQLKKNILILPVHSRSLNQTYDLKNDQYGNYNSIQFYESSFIKFMMEEIVMSHLRQYNPSCIILSYSGKIKIDNQYFVQLIKQLTVISNFRLLFYPNKSKMFCFQQKDQHIISGEEFFNKQYQQYKINQQNNIDIFYQKNSMNSSFLNSFNTRNFDLNFLQKISIFLKVSSGTYNLSKNVQEDSHIQKFKNYKIMRYSALLLKLLAKQFPSIQRIKMRAHEYLTISKVLKNNYANKPQTFDKLFQKVVSKYHQNLLKIIQKFLFVSFQQNNSKKIIHQLHQIIPVEQEQYLLNESFEQIKNFSSTYDLTQKKQLWQNFKFQYRLQLSTDKTQSRIYLHIPKLKDKQSLNTSKNVDDFIVAAQFQIVDDKQKIAVQFTSNTKILYQKSRNHKDVLVYVINHMAKQSSTNYLSFYGYLNETIQQKSDSKITLKPLIFEQQRRLSQFQHYIDFNYFQTNKYIFLFWPKIFNQVKQKICRLIDQKYLPETTWNIFRAQRQQPGIFYQMKIINQTYQYILPRNGCTCYQYSQSINRFYIFGGFYNDTENYFKFQTDVTYIDFSDQSNQCKVQNLSKNFYILTSSYQQMPNTQFIKQLKNDFIRPKIGYQIFQPQNINDKQKKQIFLIGGIGQKFTRPFSLISYTGSKITFLQNGQIQSIRKIKTNNLLPVNTYNPIKIRSPQQMNIVSNAQNRTIQMNEGTVTQQSYSLSHYRYKFDVNQDKFDYQTVYQFSDLDKKSYRDQTQLLRRPPSQFPTKYQLMASSFRGKQFNDNFIKVSSQNGKKYIFQLQLQLPTQVRSQYQNYQKVVKLTGASIKAIDINASMLYCLIKHQFYTLDKCILAHFDINQLAGKLVDSKQVQINLKQIHKFDADVSKNIIVVANSGTVAVLHGFKLNSQIQIKQIIIKKSKKLKILTVLPCNQKSKLIDQKILNKRIFNQISTSFFINQNSGIIICLTFKTIDRLKQDNSKIIQVIYVHIQKLDIKKQQCRWSRIFQKVFKLQIFSDPEYNTQKNKQINQNDNINEKSTSKNDYIRLIQVKSNKQSKQKKQKQYLIKAIFKQQVYTCVLNIQTQTDILIFAPMKQSQQTYYNIIYKDNIKNQSIMLEKGLGTYQEIRQEVYNYNMHGNHNQLEKSIEEGFNLSKMVKEQSYIESEDIN